jgi:hypothetical protein
MIMDRKLITICILTLTAVALMIANFAAPPAVADVSVNGRDYQLVTATIQTGGDGLYILDNRTGYLVVFTYDANTRTLKPRAVRAVADAFR